MDLTGTTGSGSGALGGAEVLRFEQASQAMKTPLAMGHHWSGERLDSVCSFFFSSDTVVFGLGEQAKGRKN